MKKYFLTTIAIALCTLFTSAQSSPDFSGTWEGKLDVGVSLRFVFHIQKDSQRWTATADSPDQSAFGIKCDTVVTNGNNIKVELRKANATYEGKLIGDSVLDGTFTQGGSVPLVLKRGTGAAAVNNRPQTPLPPYPYKSEDIEYYNADKSMQYGATITIPNGKGPFPAALLITGSGPQDRDETIFGHKPFAVIADALTKDGFIVLRVDDRGIGKTSGKFNGSTTGDFADDANNSLNYLLSRPETDKKKTGLIGHSEGGMIAPLIASKRKEVNFIILLAGPGIKLDSLMLEQNNAVLLSVGVNKEAVAAYNPLYKELLHEVVAPTDSLTTVANLTNSIQKWKAGTDSSVTKILGLGDGKNVDQMVTSLMQSLRGEWYRYFLAFDPSSYLEKLHCKVLALNGSKDIQVISSSNLAGIEAAFKKSGLKDYTIKEMPGLNHLFQTCIKCTAQEYAELQETFSPAALKEMTEWLNKNVK